MVDWPAIPLALAASSPQPASVEGAAGASRLLWLAILAAFLSVLCAAFIWRLRKGRNRRADEASETPGEPQEVRIIAWSKSRIQFLREAFAPETRIGLPMSARDPVRRIDRKLNVTDVTNIAVLSPVVGGTVTSEERSPKSLRVATVSTTVAMVTIAYAEERVPRNWRVAIAALLLVVAASLYVLERDAARNDLTYRGAQLPMVGTERTATNPVLARVSRATVGNLTPLQTRATSGVHLSLAPQTPANAEIPPGTVPPP